MAAKGLVRWDVASNSLYPAFKPAIGADNKTAKVYDVKYFCGRLWVAGDFTSAGGVTRTALVSLDPTTGAATNHVNLDITGTASANAGPTRVYKIAPSPNCRRVVIIGNFTKIGGRERYQVAVLNVSPTTGVASLAPWYSPYHLRASQPGVGATPCSPDTVPVWGRDIDWAPDGTWWALATHRRPPPVPDALRLGQPVDEQRQPGRATGVDQLQRRGHLPQRPGDRRARVRRRPLQGARPRRLPAGQEGLLRTRTARTTGSASSTRHSPAGCPSRPGTTGRPPAGARAGRRCWSPAGGPGSAAGLWVGGDSDLIRGETGKRIALLPLI